MLSVIASGRVNRILKKKTKTDKSYYNILLSVEAGGDDTSLVNANIFDPSLFPLIEKIQRGEALSLGGFGTPNAWLPPNETEPRASLSLVVQRVMTHKAAKDRDRAQNNGSPHYDPTAGFKSKPMFGQED